MRMALVNGRVLVDDRFEEGQAVLVEGGTIAGLCAANALPEGVQRCDLGGNFLMPGFIDTQVNGGGGVLFNDRPDADGIAAIGAAHRRFGTTGFLPTLISDDLDKIGMAMEAVRVANARGVPGVLGIHVEGPFLNIARRGIHAAEQIRAIDADAVALLSRPLPGRTMLTIAPEMVPGELLEALVGAGVVVSAGHSEASYDTVISALDRGVRGFTHLFNAMSQLGNRQPGMVGAALDDGRGWCGIIVDGRHVHSATLRIALRAGSRERFMLVTDAMPTVGMTDKAFTLYGKSIRVENGVCVDDQGTLAGSDLDMAAAVRNAVELLGLGLAEAATMASRAPAEFLGLGDVLGRIAPGYRADLVLATERLDILQTWIGGVPSS